ncbi:putative calpain-like cysteine peptidase [Leishmania mexicana MHOM/GT/2001/U1103]|uniref:Calpain-like cysteine peptidase n=1 Tax=Leishmania mexicana (strain MHOM/GT/2001/U1103) TaxID=929439 RepID=E9B0X6_LEIMU|nr:putative calpain-like cysteine peptidase [Leishmania mexicana MHOM/GT/2001/U1103]CBZ28881.1 putative calpain-like cysteine peptidase [Leishmania mexicana MHOM/GT/2001/U1103]
MSYYIGYSQREIYKKRCSELGCACNSAVVRLLSDVPGEVTGLTSLDLSRNFLGRKGIIPLLDVIESAVQLRSLDLRDQQLSDDTVAVICARLRQHPSLLKLNLSNNPITLASSSALLELANQNSVVQYIFLDNTLVRPSMVTAIEVQLEKNRELVRAASAVLPVADGKSRRIFVIASSVAETCSVCSKPGSPRTEQVVLSTPAGSGKSAAAMLLHDANPAPTAAGSTGPSQRIPAHELQHVLRSYTHGVADFFFDVNPTKDAWMWCEDRHYVFDDDQFSSHNDHLHRTARHTYGIAGWRRIGELYPDATLFGWEGAATHWSDTARQAAPSISGADPKDTCKDPVEDMMGAERAAAGDGHRGSDATYSHATSVLGQLPTDIPEGFTWTFAALMASVKEIQSLHALFCASSTGLLHGGTRVQRGTASPGIYTMRMFVEGQWRYLLVDDFLPVDKYGRLIFTKPSMDSKAFWPCIFEKMLAKVHGGYHLLDAHFDKHHVGIDSPNIRKPIAWQFLRKENLQRANSGAGEGGDDAAVHGGSCDTVVGTVPDDSLICEEVAKNCGRVMSRLTRGIYDSYPLHPVELASPTLFEGLHMVLGVPLCNADVREEYGSPPCGRQTASVKRSFLESRSISLDSRTGASGVSSNRTGAIAFSRDASRTFSGIHPRCGYQIVRVCHTGGVRLLELRNPWCGTEKWSGDWADDSPLWKKHPEVAELLLTCAHSGRRTPRAGSCLLQLSNSALTLANMSVKRSLLTALSERGGSLAEASLTTPVCPVMSHSRPSAATRPHVPKSTFWISYTDFLQNFEWVHTCRIFGDEFYRQDVHGTWTRDSAGGNAREPSWYRNPHYRLSFLYRTMVHVQLTRRDPGLRRTRGAVRGQEDGVGGIGLQLLRDTHYPLHCPPASRRQADTSTTASLPMSSVDDIVAGNQEDDGSVQEALGGRDLGAIERGSGCAFSSVLSSEERQSGDCLSLGILLDAGAQYWIVPTTYAPRVLDEFDLVVTSTSPFVLQGAQESQYWDHRTVPSELLCCGSASARQVGRDDGEVAIFFDSKTRVSRDANLLLQKQGERSSTRLSRNSVNHFIETESTMLSSATCRVVVAATMHLSAAGEDMMNFGVDEACEQPSLPAEDMYGTPTLQLAITPGEVDGEGRPTRTVCEFDPHAAQTYVLDRHTVLETAITPAPHSSVEYYTAICSLHPAGTRVHVDYRVWCAAPLLEVMTLPVWAKQEVELCWDDEKGSGSYYEGTRHPQVELSKLRPLQRFDISLRMVDYDTIEPAIMFSVIGNDRQQGEPVEGRLESRAVLSQSAYVDGTYVQGSFDLDERPPESLIIIPCLQPTSSKGRCLMTISSDSADYGVYPLRVAAAYPP